MSRPTLFRVGVLLISAACMAAPPGDPGLAPQTPWYDGLGRHHRKITTEDDGAQGYFDQGVAFLMAANPDEALRSFEEAARFDPRCAMAYWGLAMAHGPQVELPPPGPEREVAAVAAVNRAHELARQRALPVEQALIAALARRHTDPPPADRRTLDLAYAEAMRAVWQAYPEEPDVGSWFADALLQAAAAPRWTADGKPDATTAEVIEVLGRVLQREPKHPLANRLHVLVYARSPAPERAEASAQALRSLAPGLGHLLYLPARIDERLGRWEQAIAATRDALAADRRYLELSGRPPDRYRLTMALHALSNIHVAMMTGQSAAALSQARALLESLPPDWREKHPRAADRLLAAPLQVMVRFARWDEILAEPEIAPRYPMSRALQHAARGLALVAQQDLVGARSELEHILGATSTLAADATGWGEAADLIAAVAAHLVTGQILLQEQEGDAALAAFRYAVEAGDAMRSSHACFWLLPSRHALGTALLTLRRLDEAQEVFEADLEQWPNNGWALLGVAQSLQLQEQVDEAAAVEARFVEAWQHADVTIDRPWMAGAALHVGTAVAER